jgi:hypothetical protein
VAAGLLAATEEPAFQRFQQFAACERLQVLRTAVAFRDVEVVFESVVRSREGVVQLVAFEQIVVPAWLVARSILRVYGPTDGPESALFALDPDHDGLGDAPVVDTVNDPFGEAARRRFPPHAGKDTIAPMQRLASLLRSPFSFLFARSSTEERVAAYVIREHGRGRGLAEILEDRYVQNRLSPHQRLRMLDRPEVIQALGDETVDDARRDIDAART